VCVCVCVCVCARVCVNCTPLCTQEIKKTAVSDPAEVHAFEKEAARMAALHPHRNVIAFYGMCEVRRACDCRHACAPSTV
jgi:hypothetical protein